MICENLGGLDHINRTKENNAGHFNDNNCRIVNCYRVNNKRLRISQTGAVSTNKTESWRHQSQEEEIKEEKKEHVEIGEVAKEAAPLVINHSVEKSVVIDEVNGNENNNETDCIIDSTEGLFGVDEDENVWDDDDDGNEPLANLITRNDKDSASTDKGSDSNCNPAECTTQQPGKGISETTAGCSQGEDNRPPFHDNLQESSPSSLNKQKADSESNSHIKYDNNLMECFICGASLQHIQAGYKGRLNHIKRCSKRHGVTARDMRVNDDYELFVGATNNKNTSKPKSLNFCPSSSSTTICNPYQKKQGNWHGDAETDLMLTATGVASSTKLIAKPTSTTNGKDSRSLFSVLLAGARRTAKTSRIVNSNIKAATGQEARRGGRNNNKRKWARTFGGGSWGRKSPHSCPAYKKIVGTNFVCDGFQYASETLTDKYFLTHFHSDHYGGITKQWNAGTIYCTLATANLVNQQLGVDRKFLHPVPLHQPLIVESRGKPVTVTFLDANHCPGAVIILFEIGKRKILHTGDFRWNRDTMMPPLRSLLSTSGLDDLYLDTTYCDPKYNLPTQKDAIAATVKVAEQEMSRATAAKRKVLMLFGAYTIGKERIYMAVAKHLKCKVYVDSRRYRILSALQWPKEDMDLFTTCPEKTNVWVCPLGHINMKKLPTYLDVKTKKFKTNFDGIVGFRPTGWTMSSRPGKGLVTATRRGNLTVYSVPYSEHSSFTELVDCLATLKPKKIIPTVSVSKSQQQIEVLLRSLRVKQTTLDALFTP